jgi:NAD(P)-dependent dehydrogenase (short-subunit alcohol dehydrogenase family)
MRGIRGKKALVTGVASGIGRALALRLAAEGADLFLVDVDEAGLAVTVSESRKAGVEVIGRQCDVGQPAQISAAVADVLARWGGVDILINNAGITYYGRTSEMSAEHWDQLLRVNLHSHIQFTRELLPSLLERPEAHIVNVCSMFGLVGMPKLAAYCTTKFALVGLSDSLRAEYGRYGLGVTALCPGFVRTNLFTSAPLPPSAKSHKIPPRIFSTTPERVAAATIRAIRRNRRLVVVEPSARFLCTIKRLAPGVIDFFLNLGRRKRIAQKATEIESGKKRRRSAA